MYNNIKDISHYLNKYYLNNTSLYPPNYFHLVTQNVMHMVIFVCCFKCVNVYNLYQL